MMEPDCFCERYSTIPYGSSGEGESSFRKAKMED